MTGRDIKEGEYALLAEDGILWRLDGTTLDEAGKQAAKRREKGHLGERQRSLLLFVCSRTETSSDDAAGHLRISPKHAGDALRELHDAGRIVRLRRGVYGPIPASIFLSPKGGPSCAVTPERPERPEKAGQRAVIAGKGLPEHPEVNLK